MGANLPSSSAEGGFFSRIVFVHCDEIKLTSPLPRETDESTQLKAALINDLIHINAVRGQVTFTEEAAQYYTDWYMNPDRPGYNGSTDQRTSGYYVRKQIHVLKVAMLLMLAERDDLLLQKKDLEMAFSVLASIDSGIGAEVGSVGRNDMLVHTQNVVRQIRGAGSAGLDYQKVLRAHIHNIKRQELDEIIQTMIATQEIRALRDGKVYRLFAIR